MRKSLLIDAGIILGFALLHAVVALGCRLIGLTDELMLTLLTMLLVVIICLRRDMKVEFMAISVILVNVLGFLSGAFFAWVFGFVSSSPLVIYPSATFLTTILLGGGIYWLTFIFPRFRGNAEAWDRNGLKWIIAAFVVILVMRLAIILLTSESMEEKLKMNILADYLLSCLVLLFLANLAIRSRAKAIQDRESASLAQYNYLILKQQVNPHFLFNSLNVLDCLVGEGKDEQASEYIHKLASVYRYMLKNEEETLVRLKDEMVFVNQYIDLLQLRFPEGLIIDSDIPAAAMNRFVVPCSLQLLIENATKHNVVSLSSPLHISIKVEDGKLVVTNNVTPKFTSASSTGLGLKYIRQQYKGLTKKGVEIIQREGVEGVCSPEYTVKLPLL